MALVRIPASSANLGPGFDCLGLALNVYNYVQLEESGEPLKITLGGRYQENIPTDERNLVYRSAQYLWQKIGYRPAGVSLHLVNNIPPARGLGSSAAAILGGMCAANILAGGPLPKEQILCLAAALEGHPDNAAAGLYGGVTLAVRQPDGSCVCRLLGQMAGVKIVAAIPKTPLATKTARELLPLQVPLADAVWNLGRTGLLVAAIIKEDYSLLKVAMDDKLHEPYRARAIPSMSAALAAARRAGALGAALSGAGPTLIAFVQESADEVLIGKAMYEASIAHGGDCEINYLTLDRSGAIEIEPVEHAFNLLYGGLAC